MCKAFSCLVTRTGKVYWKLGLDSHDEIREHFKTQDPELRDNKEPPEQTFARCEYTPCNNDYLNPDVWKFQIDEPKPPAWWVPKLEEKVEKKWRKWKRELYASINLKEARNPVHPFKIKPPKKITERHLKLLREWDSVWASVRDSVWAYIGSLFPKIKDWNVDKSKPPFDKIRGYPFQSVLDLWMQGLVPSFNGKIWRLHGSKDAKILWEGTLKEESQ